MTFTSEIPARPRLIEPMEPGLRVITGRPADLRESLALRVAALRRDNPLTPLTIVVGGSLQRPFLQRWLATRLGGHANVRILMPGDLALLLGAPTLVAQGRRALPPLADRVLLGAVARAHGGYFAPVAEASGFGEALFRLVRDLRAAGYDLADLGKLLHGATDAPEKAASLAEILADFESRRRGFYGPDDALLAADPSRLAGLGLLVWGMLDISPALERALLGIAERMEVDVYLADVPAGADAPLSRLGTRLASRGTAQHMPSRSDDADFALQRVRQKLFTAPDGSVVPADDSLRLVSAPDPSREVRAAARACLGWAREGVPFWKMAVAYRHGEAYLPLTEAVFVEAGIPVYLHEGSPLSQRPVGRQTLALLELFDSDLSRQSVMDFLTDAQLPPVLHEEYRGDHSTIPTSRWDAISRDAGVVAGLEQWTTRLGARSETPDAGGDTPDWKRGRAGDAAGLLRFIVDLQTRLSSAPARASWSVHLDYLHGLLERYVKSSSSLIVALRGLERFTALDSEVEFTRFLDVVKRAIATLRSEDVIDSRPGAFARRGVNIVAVNSLVGIEFDRVWLLGATERSFPAPVRQDPILLDAEREAVSARAPAPLTLRAARGAEEALVFALAFEAARERLVVSYARRATGESRPRLPSVFFREVASQLEGRRVSADDAPLLDRPDLQRIAGDAIGAPIPDPHADVTGVLRAADSAVSEPERDRTLLQTRATRPLALAVLEHTEPSLQRALEAGRAWSASRYSAWDGALGPEAVAALARLLPADRPLAPTALESFAACPQRFLLDHVLRIRAVEEPENVVRIDARARGNVIHTIFERFHADWTGAGPASLSVEAATRMLRIAGEECDAARDRGETGYPAMWEADREGLIDDCLRWLAAEQADPLTRELPEIAVEARFGKPRPDETPVALSSDAPIEIDLPSGPLLLHGRIDRVNWDPGHSQFRVVDYKTGKVRDEKSAQLQGGRMLQLPLYVLAASQLLGIDASAGSAAYIYPTRRGGFRTIDWPSEQIAARRQELLGLLNAIVTAARRGEFLIAPHSEDACRYCAFNGICPGARGGYQGGKEGDERLATLATSIRSVP